MTTAHERKTMAILEEISIGSTVPMGGGFVCADQGKPYEYPKPWTLEEMQAPLDQPLGSPRIRRASDDDLATHAG